MSQYFDLSIRRIEIKKPKRDLKPVIKLQDEVNKTLLHDEYYYPTDERTIQECLDGDYILLGVYNDVGVKSPDPDACGALRGVIHINIHIECISANNIHTCEYLYKKEVKK